MIGSRDEGACLQSGVEPARHDDRFPASRPITHDPTRPSSNTSPDRCRHINPLLCSFGAMWYSMYQTRRAQHAPVSPLSNQRPSPRLSLALRLPFDETAARAHGLEPTAFAFRVSRFALSPWTFGVPSPLGPPAQPHVYQFGRRAGRGPDRTAAPQRTTFSPSTPPVAHA